MIGNRHVLLAAACVSLATFAKAAIYTEAINGIQWTYIVSGGKASVGGGTTSSTAVPTSTTGAIAIPSELGGYPVTSIGYFAFHSCTNLTNVTIPDSVTRIGHSSFYNCSSLTRVVIPDSVTSIDNSTFYNCRSLTSVVIPDSVTSIGNSTFYNCSSLTSVTIPVCVISIGSYAFYGCSGLTSMIIPDSVTSIGDSAFYGCRGLTSVTIGNGVTSIGSGAFYCSSLKSVQISDLAVWCSISFGESSANPLRYAHNLYLNGSLVSALTIPDGVTSIESSAFYGCSGLTSVTIPNSVTNIGNNAFSGCRGLTSVTIGNGVTSIGSGAFYDCTSLASVQISDPAVWCSISFGNYAANPLYYAHNLYLNGSLVCALTIPDGVTSIGSKAFWNCSGLKSVTLPNSVTSIGNEAFYNCSGLTSVTIPDSVTSIGSSVFSGCSGLVSMTIPFVGSRRGNSGTDDSLFGYIFGTSSYSGGRYTRQRYSTSELNDTKYYYIPSALKSVTITDETVLGYGAFDGCSGLADIGLPSSITSICINAFCNCSGIASMAIPNSVVSIGLYAFKGCSGLSNVTIGNGMTSIATWGFRGCTNLTTVTIPDSVTSIEWGAFYGCKSLASLVMPNSVTNIDAIAFAYSGLRSVTIPDSVTSVEYMTFGGCSNLTSIVMSNNITNIAYHAFEDCLRLGDVEIPDSVECIAEYTFAGCSGLTSMTIPDSVTSIGNSAFYGCSGLTNIVFGCSVTNIEKMAFSGCTHLRSVVIPVTVVNIDTNAFKDCNYPYIYLPATYSGNTWLGGCYICRYKSEQIVTFSVEEDMVTPDSIVVIYNSEYGSLPLPERNGYSFAGWLLKDKIITDCTIVSALNDHTLVAQWTPNQYIVTFDANGGQGGSSSERDYGDELVAPTVSRAGYTFKGWSPSVSATVPLGGATYTAQWEINQYTVEFNANGGEGGTRVSQDYDTPIVVPTVSRFGYTFKGWSPSVAVAVPAYDVTYTALWEANKYTVTFDANGGSGGTSGKQDYGTAIVPPTVTRAGCTFMGWSPSVNATVPASNVTYTAQWEINQYAVTFDANGGEGSTSAKLDYGTSIVVPTVTRTGYTFMGWSPSVSATVPAHDVTYTAQWEINQYTVTFDANGGEGGTSVKQDYGSAIVAPTVTRMGYKFNGWSPEVEEIVPDHDVIFVAQWEEAFFHYSVVDGKATITGCALPIGVVTIPSIIGGYSVTEIASCVFSNCTNITQIIIPDSVKSIGDCAFYGCSGLTSMTIPNSVINIGAGAFSGCSGLSEISIPFVGSSRGNAGGADALFGYVFGTSSYAGGTSTKQYYSASSYSTFYIPSTLRRVVITGESTFAYGAFSYCNVLTNITFGSSVTNIGPAVFRGCSGLTSVAIPKSIASIGNQAFDGCRKLTKVHVDDVAAWCNIKFGNYYSNPLVYANKFYVDDVPVSELMIPNSVTSIGDFAFCKCSGLTSVTIPDSVIHIGAYAFRNCNGLTYVRIPNSVTSIDNNAFYSCTKLIFVEIGNSLVSIGESAFESCSKLTSVTIPNSVTSIGSYAFRDCSGLTSVIIPDSVTSIGSSAFSGTPFYDGLPDGLVILGSVLCGMKGACPSIVEIPDGVSSIGSRAFYNCSGMTSVTIPNSVTSIGTEAFYGCSGLTSVTIPDSVTSIGQSAFYGCSGWRDIFAPQAVCSSRLSSIFPSTYFNSITNVTISTSVTNIGYSAFDNCIGLTSVMIPDSVTSIGSRAFSGCIELTSVTIPDSVMSIGNYAFYNCCGLTSITFDGDAPTVGSSAFYNLASDCCIYVRRASSGWGVEIPGRWNGIAIDYVHHDVRLDANGGMCDAVELSVADGSEIGELPVATKDEAEFYGWFTDRAGGEMVTASTVILDATTLYAHWLTEVDTPVVSTSGGSVFRLDSCEVTISCATEGAVIYYTDDGSTPKRNDDYLYTGPITITDTTTFKAIAVYGSLKSDYVTATIMKQGLTIEEALDEVEGVVFATDAAIPWKPVLDSTAKIGEATVKSGTIGDRASTWLSATVEGAGTMTFWCKTSCEHDEDDMFTWDRLMIYTNDVEIVEWHMDGETDWTERTLSFDGGANTVKWVYYKDRTGADGEDCAWVDGVSWVPASLPVAPSIPGDPDAVVTGSAESGFTVKPSATTGTVEVSIPDGVDAAKVTVEVPPTVESVTPNGATIRIVKDGHDITPFLDIPEADGEGAVATQLAAVKEAIVKETIDTTKGAKVELKPSNPSIKTAPTRPGLTYTFSEGTTLKGMTQKAEKQGDGEPWTPPVTVKGGVSGFYSIGVGK